MANFNPLVKPSTDLSRNPFDLSRRDIFSAKPGMLLPVMCVDTVPNDYFEVSAASLIKTMPVRTDAFARMKGNFEFYFVRYSDLWPQWHSFITQRNLPTSSYHRGSSFVPYFDRENFLNNISKWCKSADTDSQGINYGLNALRLSDLLGYGAYYDVMPSVGGQGQNIIDDRTYAFNAFRICAYQKIWYDYYRNKWYDTNENLIYCWSLADIGSTSEVPDYNIYNTRSDGYGSPLNNPESSSYSFDIMNSNLFTMRYRQWKKDLFTSVMPSQQFGVVSSVDLGSVSIVNNFKASRTPASVEGVTHPNYPSELYLGTTSASQTLSEDHYRWTIPSAFNVYDLKRAEYLQKWKETILRAGEDLGSQYQGRFGMKPKAANIGDADYIGSFDADVEINPIYQSSDTDTAPLGEVGGRGSAIGQGNIKFHADDYGVFMCIFSILPEAEYDSPIDRCSTMFYREDFFTPEVQDLGLEPVYRYQLDSLGQVTPYSVDSGVSLRIGGSQNDVLGFSTRYSYYKTSIDRVHGAFRSRGMSLSSSRSPSPFASWVMSRKDLAIASGALELNRLYVSPFIDESIFYKTSQDEEDDHFLVDAHFNIKAVRPMHVLGLPQW